MLIPNQGPIFFLFSFSGREEHSWDWWPELTKETSQNVILIHHYCCILLFFPLLNCSCSTNKLYFNSLPHSTRVGDDRGEVKRVALVFHLQLGWKLWHLVTQWTWDIIFNFFSKIWAVIEVLKCVAISEYQRIQNYILKFSQKEALNASVYVSVDVTANSW